jgi:hypothetical protein
MLHLIKLSIKQTFLKVLKARGSVTIILCLHVLIARRILLILDMLIISSEYRCLKMGWQDISKLCPPTHVKTHNTVWLP